MAVGGGAAVAGKMLEHRQHTAVGQPGRDRARDGRDLGGGVAIGAVADHRIGVAHRHVGNRQAVDRDAERRQVRRDQPPAQLRGRQPEAAVTFVQARIGCARRIGGPLRRTQPLHPSTFLVDQDRSIQPAYGPAEIINQGSNLRRRADIAFEQDQAPRRCGAQERPLVRGDFQTRQTRDEGPHRHRRGLPRDASKGKGGPVNSSGSCRNRRRI
jgi:hypothetical protein